MRPHQTEDMDAPVKSPNRKREEGEEEAEVVLVEVEHGVGDGAREGVVDAVRELGTWDPRHGIDGSRRPSQKRPCGQIGSLS